MKLKKSETNNAIITTLANVRKHPNADRLKLATVLGTQVIVGLEAKNGDKVIYFDSNLKLSHEYLRWNNLYSNKEMNRNSEGKGYFGKNGRVRAQKLRGEISNGYAADMESITLWPEIFTCVDSVEDLKEGDEFTHINGIEICSKYFVEKSGGVQCGKGKKKKKSRVFTNMFWKMWDTKHLMREIYRIVPGTLYVEEKIHGTSGRTANALYYKRRRWWQVWKPRFTPFWKVVSGTRRVDGTHGHMGKERREIHEKLAPHIHRGEQLYFEIYGYHKSGRHVQKGFTYGCEDREYKVMLYRVTITTEDGYCIDLDREQVYQRAEELGLEKPSLLSKFYFHDYEGEKEDIINSIVKRTCGKSSLDEETILEGIVLWFRDKGGSWTCLKHKSEEFLIRESRNKDKEVFDPEDNL